MNNIIKLSGRITHDLSLHTSKTNLSSLNFTIAHPHGYGDKAKTYFFRCVSFGKTAEFIHKHFKKGAGIIVTGELRNNNYEKDGHRFYAIDVFVSDATFMEASASINTVLLTGRLVDVPKTNLNNGDRSVARFTVATRKTYKVSENSPTADFLSVVTFGKQAEAAGRFLTKGASVAIVGHFSAKEYTQTTDETIKKCQYDVIVEPFGLSFLDKKKTHTEDQTPVNSLPFTPVDDDDDLPF